MKFIRKLLFYIIMLLIPVAFFALLELILWLTGFGDSYPLVKKAEIFGKERYVVNTEVARRYFILPPDKTPQPLAEYFDIEKPEKTLRLFCLGGSTTAGFPFEMNVTFPFQLQYRLRNELFEGWAEAINLGIAAVNSHTVLDLLPEVLELQPDGLIVYMGHNEFYGALGVGSSQYVSSNRTLIQWYLWLREWRTFQLLQRIIASIRPEVNADEAPSTMMQAMAREQSILLDSDAFETACRNFEENLVEIVQLAKARNVPVILSTLVSNLKDQPPFVADFSGNLDESARQRGDKLLTEAENQVRAGDAAQALATLDELIAIDSTHALVHYLAGQAQLALGDSVAANRSFVLAKDYDLLRFRAPEVFNEIIRRVAKTNDVPLVDMEAVFRAESPGKITGKELFLEHLHPNFDGYRLMGETFLRTLKTIQIINPPKPIGWRDSLLSATTIDEIRREYRKSDGGVTELDIEFGLYRNFWLVNRWPFPEKKVTNADYPAYGSRVTREIAIKRFAESTPWEQAHYALADFYISTEQYEAAQREFRAVRLRFVEDFYPPMKLGDMRLLQNDSYTARTWYERALDLKADYPPLLARMGRLYVAENNFTEAKKYLKQALDADEASPILTRVQKAEVLYLSGASCANLKEFEAADTYLTEALRLQPGYEAAHQLQQQLRRFRDKS